MQAGSLRSDASEVFDVADVGREGAGAEGENTVGDLGQILRQGTSDEGRVRTKATGSGVVEDEDRDLVCHRIELEGAQAADSGGVAGSFGIEPCEVVDDDHFCIFVGEREVERMVKVAGDVAVKGLGDVDLAKACEAEPGRETILDGQLARDRRQTHVTLGELPVCVLEVEIEDVLRDK